jgi:hypothetical protein
MAAKPRVSDDEIMEVIRVYHKAHGYWPSVRDVAAITGYSVSVAWARMNKMMDKGLLSRPYGRARALGVGVRVHRAKIATTRAPRTSKNADAPWLWTTS